jgi:hypothetical protein
MKAGIVEPDDMAIVGRVVFYVGRVVSKEITLFLPELLVLFGPSIRRHKGGMVRPRLCKIFVFASV